MTVQMQSGGMFNSYKIQYSPETHNLLKGKLCFREAINSLCYCLSQSSKRILHYICQTADK